MTSILAERKNVCREVYRLLNEANVEGLLPLFHESCRVFEAFPSRTVVLGADHEALAKNLQVELEAAAVRYDNIKIWGEGDVLIARFETVTTHHKIETTVENHGLDMFFFDGDRIRELRRYTDTLAAHFLKDVRQGPAWLFG